jgi:DNA-binding NtrC family response regulator
VPRILIVDDEVKLVKKLKKLLENDGYKIETAANGLEALDIINKPTQIDVVISDIRMEKMDGLTFLKEIQQKNLDLGVIMITGYGNMDTYLDSVYFGAFEYMQKPLNYETLLKAINRLLRDKKRKRKKVKSHQKERK